MSKRNATDYRLSRKKRKAGSSYALVNADAENSPKVEDVRVWKVAVSDTTGRVLATRTNRQLNYERSPKASFEEAVAFEEASKPPDPAPSDPPTASSQTTKPKKARGAKGNDSVSAIPPSSTEPILTR